MQQPRNPKAFPAQIGAERARVADLQRRATQAQAQVEEQRRKMGGLRAAQDCDIQVPHLPILAHGSPDSASHNYHLTLAAMEISVLSQRQACKASRARGMCNACLNGTDTCAAGANDDRLHSTTDDTRS